ncbi:hypothetical protein JHK87_011735 [Glycine soja]|nr:hypothetical protein JHK87_011735 [Glycine soja]
MDDSNENPRLPHRRNPNESVSLDQLADFGVLYWKLNPTTWKYSIYLLILFCFL